MNILVTGNKGFIGSNLQKVLPNSIGYDLVTGADIRDEKLFYEILKTYNIDTIIHLAAQVSVEESKVDPVKYIDHNVLGTQKVITMALKAGVKKIVYASSSACYEPNSTPYAMSKYIPEIMLDIAKYDIKTVSLRFFNIYGPGSNPAYSRVIDAFIDGIKNKNEIDIYGDGEQTRDFIHIDDIIECIRLAIEKDIPSGMVLDLGTGISTSVNNLADIMMNIFDKKVNINCRLGRKEVRHSVAKISLASKLLGFRAKINLEQGLKGLIGV